MSLTSVRPGETLQLKLALNVCIVFLPSRLGSGGFGKVYKIRHKTTGKKFAAKYQKLNNERMRKMVHEETYFLKRLSEGKRVVDIYNYYEKDKHSLMVLELLEGGELFSVVGASKYILTELKCAHFTLDIVKAINYLHENQVDRNEIVKSCL